MKDGTPKTKNNTDRPNGPNDTPWLNVEDEINEALGIENRKLNIIIKNIHEYNNKCDDVLIQEIKLHTRSHRGVQMGEGHHVD